MKNLYILAFSILSFLPTYAQTSIPTNNGSVVFSSVNSSEKVGLSYNIDGTLTEQDVLNLEIHLDNCINNSLHPLGWAETVHQDINLFFKIKGDLVEVLKMVNDHRTLDNNSVSWIWADAQNPTVSIYLKRDGVGFVTLRQNNQIVGRSICKSVEGDKRPTEGECKIVRIWRDPAPKKYTLNDQKPTVGRKSKTYDSWMPWALETNNSKQGIFLHGGSQFSNSMGCVRFPKKFAEMLHKIAKVDMRVSITLEP